MFLEMFWLRNTRWSHCLSEASLRLSCMLLAGRLSHRTTERRSRCVDAFLCRLRTIHEDLQSNIIFVSYKIISKKLKCFTWNIGFKETLKLYIYWSFTQSNIAQQIPEHAAIPIRPARRLAAIRANSLRSDRALGGSN